VSILRFPVIEKNWIKTKPGEGWFSLPRLYAPLEPIINKEWRWNDIERIKPPIRPGTADPYAPNN